VPGHRERRTFRVAQDYRPESGRNQLHRPQLELGLTARTTMDVPGGDAFISILLPASSGPP